MSTPPVSLIVLAGGKSRRMGQPKALLPVPGSGEPLIRHVIRRLIALVGEELIVVTNTPTIWQTVSAHLAATFLAD
ncbi:MAG: NTP transferase domain-containing protein, partial [Alphaproteobacteria bacterium]|nr:NTP transferase domain-containing protein [Alphaproteobacteria bacterium]